MNLNAGQNTFVLKKILEIGFSWNAAKHDFMRNTCLSTCLFKTWLFVALELPLGGRHLHDEVSASYGP